jgi:hypothetical protein
MKPYRIYRTNVVESRSDGQIAFSNSYLEYFSNKKDAVEVMNKKIRDKWGCSPRLLQERVGDKWINIARRTK